MLQKYGTPHMELFKCMVLRHKCHCTVWAGAQPLQKKTPFISQALQKEYKSQMHLDE